MSSLTLIPWAETDWSLTGRLAAAAALPLTADGAAQAQQWGQMLSKRGLKMVFTAGDMTSRQTADGIATGHNAGKLKLRNVNGLEEVRYGLWEGLTPQKIKERFPKAYKRWMEDPSSVRPPEGESLPDAHHRIVAAVRLALKKAAAAPCGLVMGPMASALARCEIEGRSLSHMRELMLSEPIWYDSPFDAIDTKPAGTTA